MAIARVGVIGAGTMGRGVAQSVAQAGLSAVLVDVSERQLDCAQTAIERELRRHGRFEVLRGKSDDIRDCSSAIDRIRFTENYNELANVDFVVENATENWEVKRQVHSEVGRLVREEVVVAVNTSAIPITRAASLYKHPARIVGMHFMNPVPMMPMVEVIRAHHTSNQTVETASEFISQLGKECIVVNDSPGFVTNRVMMLTVNEAAFLLYEGVSSVEDIDRLFKTCFGHKMGPLETADLIGLDTVLYSIEVLHREFNDGKYRPCPLLKRMVESGRHGRKTGEGFYSYRP